MEFEAPEAPKPENPDVEPPAAPGEFEMPAITRWDVACVGPIVAVTIWAWVGRFFTPTLLQNHFVLLEVIRGTIPAMITAGASVHVGRTPMWQALLAPVCILVAVDPFVYWSGRRYGRKLLDHLAGTTPKWRRRIAFVERFFKRWGALTILFSYFLPASGIFFLAAGEVRMSFVLFAAADIAGTMLWICLMVGLGYTFHTQALEIAATITHYANIITVLLIVVAIATAVRSTRAQLKAMPPLSR